MSLVAIIAGVGGAVVSAIGAWIVAVITTKPSGQAAMNESFRLLLGEFRHQLEQAHADLTVSQADADLHRALCREWEVWATGIEGAFDQTCAAVRIRIPDIILPDRPPRPRRQHNGARAA